MQNASASKRPASARPCRTPRCHALLPEDRASCTPAPEQRERVHVCRPSLPTTPPPQRWTARDQRPVNAAARSIRIPHMQKRPWRGGRQVPVLAARTRHARRESCPTPRTTCPQNDCPKGIRTSEVNTTVSAWPPCATAHGICVLQHTDTGPTYERSQSHLEAHRSPGMATWQHGRGAQRRR